MRFTAIGKLVCYLWACHEWMHQIFGFCVFPLLSVFKIKYLQEHWITLWSTEGKNTVVIWYSKWEIDLRSCLRLLKSAKPSNGLEIEQWACTTANLHLFVITMYDFIRNYVNKWPFLLGACCVNETNLRLGCSLNFYCSFSSPFNMHLDPVPSNLYLSLCEIPEANHQVFSLQYFSEVFFTRLLLSILRRNIHNWNRWIVDDEIKYCIFLSFSR